MIKPQIKNKKWFMLIFVTLILVLGMHVTGYALPVSDRTPEVRDAIVNAVPNISDAANVTTAHLAAITSLNLRNAGITELKKGDFSDMTGLTSLNLFNNELSSLPDGIFAGLTSLTTIRLGRNTVDPLPLTVSLEKVGTNQFKAVAPAGATFDIVLPVTVTYGSISGGATTLTILQGSMASGTLTVTRTPGTTAAVTADIGTLPSLPRNHYGYALTKSDALPIEIISGSNTAPVFTYGTSITRSVAEKTAAGTNIGTAVTATDAENDTLTYTLSGTDASTFDIDSSTGQLKTKAALDYETKTSYTVTLTVSDGNLTGTITVTINVTDIDEVVTSPITPDPPTTNSAPSFDEGDSTTRVIAENTPAGVNIGNAVLATDANNDSLAYSLGGVDADTFDLDSSGQLKTKAPIDYETRRIYSVTITADDGELSGTITVVIIVIDVHDTVLSARFVPVADRTPQVRDAIVAAVPNVTDAADVTKSQVAAITRLNLRNRGISKLKIGDFSGMTALTNLNLFGNRLRSLPAGTFNGLTALSVLRLGRNAVDPLPLIVSLQQTGNNTFKAIIPTAAPFHIELPLTVTGGSISGGTTSVTIPQGAMASTAFTVIGTSAEVSFGTLPRLPRNHFGYELAQSTVCNRTQQVADAIAEAVGVDDCSLVTEIDLAMRTSLDLSDQSIKTLKAGDFDGMLSLRTLYLDDNDLTSLPSGIFKDLISLSELHLNSNNLTVIPQGLFEGLTQLRQLHLSANMVDPLPLIVSLQKVGTNQLKATVPAGAPFTIVLPIRIQNGTLARSATTITIPIGKVESQLLTVTQSTGSFDAVTAEIGTLPNLPSLHSGYALVKGTDGPMEVLPSLNSPPIFTDGATTTRTVAENTVPNANIGAAIAATDSNQDNLTYTLGGTDAAAFAVDSATGQLKTKVALDYETKNSYAVTLTVSDGKLNDTITVTINVSNVNEAPTFTDGNSVTREIAENTSAGANIGAVITAADPDNDTLTYSLSGTDASAFALGTTTGQLKTSAALDYETKSLYTLVLTASDGNLTDTIAVTINITDVQERSEKQVDEVETPTNNPPIFTEGSTATRTVLEGTSSGVDIGAAVSATDADGHSLTYTLGGTDAAAFSIDSTSGQLRTSAALDYETKTSYAVTITVSDGNDGTDSINVVVSVTDVDETLSNNEPVSNEDNSAPVFAEGSSTTRSVAEGTGSGVDIGAAVSATDPDNDTLTYSLGGTDVSSFSINSTNGQLRTSAALDYETKTSYTVTITVSDGNDGTDSINVVISVTDVDETPSNNEPVSNEDNSAPVFTEGSSTTRSVPENTGSGVDIGSAVSATDPDNDTLTYSLGGTDAASFSINSTNGQIRTSAVLNYETKSSYSVSVSVSDGALTDTISVTINITDIDETAPNRAPVFTEGNTAARSIAENTDAGTNIGAAITATDVDGNTLTYRLGGTDASSFSIVRTTGQLQTRAALDYGMKSSYSVTVSVSDAKGGSDSIAVTIIIKEVIKPPLSQRTQQVRDAIVAAVPGVNNANNVTPAHLASITSLSLSAKEITALKADDFAGLPALTHLYMVGNSISNISPLKDLTSLIHLYLSDNSISDISALKKLTSLTHLYLSDNSISDISVLEDLTSLTDLDLTENSINDVAALEDLTSLRSLYLNENSITDYGPLQRLKAAIENTGNTISMDINNKPPEFTDGDTTTRSIAENTASGTNIGNPISATNVGTVNTLTYSLGGTDSASFSIVSTSGQLQTKVTLDYEIKQSYSVTVSVSNGNNGSDSITVTINITDVNEPITPVNERTQQVQDAIVAAVPGINSADNVTAIHLAAITELDISGEYGESNITSLQSGDFSGLTSLTKLNLFDNSISNISALSGLTSLTWLSLGYNSVRDISPLKNMTALTTLDLLDNSISDISALKNMTALTWLRLRKNSIEDISALKKMTAMTTLELSENSISDISALSGLTSLTWLNLHSNSISDISALKDMTALTELNLYGNSISNISALKKMTALTELNLHDNSISNISALSGLTALTILNLGFNSVRDISPLAGLTKLINLDLSNNSITDISKLEKLTLLTRLELNSNSITDISKLEKLTKLITLYLSSNSITDISELEHLTDLETLDLSSNSISGISALADLALINLGLSDNSITDISAIEGLITLWTLSLSENTISDYAPLRRLIVAIGAYNGTLDLDITIPEVPNNNDPVFTDGDSTTRSIAENTESDENIGVAVSATDADTADTLTYYLGGTDAASFSIVRSSGQLQTNGALDYETQTSYTVTVAVSDGKGGSDSITVTINVTDVSGQAPSFDESSVIPENTALFTNFPNPFNPETWIPYQLAKPAEVTLTIYDIRGRIVRTLILGNQPAGIYQSRSKAAHWDGQNHFGEKVATGVYFYTLKAGDFSATRKMLIRK